MRYYRVLHVITRLANGGAEESVMDSIRELANHGVYCDLVIGKELVPNTLKKFPLPEECTVHRVPHLVRKLSPYDDVCALRELRALMAAERYTIVHTHTSKAGILGRFAAQRADVPVIVGSIHGISFPRTAGVLRHGYKWLEQRAAAVSNALVCVGEDIRDIYVNAGIGVPAQYSVIYTGMDVDAFRAVHGASAEVRMRARERLGVPTDLGVTVIASVGRLQRSKNQRALIRMMPRLVRACPAVHVVFLGDGPEERRLRNYVRSLELEQFITFAGYVQNLWEVLSACDIHCFTSLNEGLPRVLVQTSAAGIPTISYAVEGVVEIIKDASSGYIVPVGDEDAFIEKLQRLVQDTELRMQFGVAGMRIADERWSLARVGAETKALYERLLKEKGIAS